MSSEEIEAEDDPAADGGVSIPVYAGTMGWGYADWVGPFYPAGSASRDYLSLYARAFDCVEIDSTFYGTPREAQVTQWARTTPERFVFCPKTPRAITHEMRLIDAREAFTEFVRVMGLLGPKRGPMLIQLPPDFTRAELPALQAFVPMLSEIGAPSARFAVEFRHRSMITPEVSALLAEHRVALVAADYAPMPRRFEITTDFVYLRLIGRHGDYPKHDRLYGGREDEIRRWANVLRQNQGRLQSAYVLCNNDYEGYSPATCNKVKGLLGLSVTERPTEEQGSLF